jgi:CheY-like chemotaxis protein
LALSNDLSAIKRTPDPALEWQSASIPNAAPDEVNQRNPDQEMQPLSSSPSPLETEPLWNLLVAEDNLPDVLIVRQALQLENLPLNIHIVSDGEEAIAFITRAEQDEHAPAPDMLLLDLNLPKVDGFEVLRHLRASARFAAVPVLIMTSSDSPDDRAQAASLGAGYFRKPPSYEAFLKLGKLLRQQMPDQRER